MLKKKIIGAQASLEDIEEPRYGLEHVWARRSPASVLDHLIEDYTSKVENTATDRGDSGNRTTELHGFSLPFSAQSFRFAANWFFTHLGLASMQFPKKSIGSRDLPLHLLKQVAALKFVLL